MKKITAVILSLIILFTLSIPAFSVSGKVSADIIAQTRRTAVSLEAEGTVLLKNEDNVLPLGRKPLNIFGAGSVVPFFGGAGSGAVTTEDPLDLYEALDEAGIPYNSELKSLYEKNCKSPTRIKTDSTVLNNLLNLLLAKSSVEEMPAEKLTDKIMNNALEFSDTAMIVISRTSAEGSDLSEETLRLTEKERATVDKVARAFPKVIVLFNTGNLMEMGWLEEYESIKAAALIWIPGEFGMEAVGEILTGKVCPSGRLADTVACKVNDHPSSNVFKPQKFDNSGDWYVEYTEGIYVGYRYFETFAPDKVQYPFGYGLSYTSFEKSNPLFTLEDDVLTASVTVKNTGDRAGKETVQLYYSAPYEQGGTEKSAVSLGGFAKTKELAPGEEQTLSISLPVRQAASYDMKEQAYVLDSGEYTVFLGDNIRMPYAKYNFTVDEKKIYDTDEATGEKIKNLFSDAAPQSPVLSRANVLSTFPSAKKLSANEAVLNKDKLPEPSEGKTPDTGVKNEEVITLRDVYEDETKWDAFLDQLTLEEQITLVIHSGYETQGIERLGIPGTQDNDGPSAVKGRQGLLYEDTGTAYPCETAIACTWNTALAEEMGKGAGMEARDMGVNVWYAPGVNLHRNPMGGRNFEYFSEDPLLSGQMAAAVIRGAKSENLVTTVKHFALNDQESHRNGLCVWADEQTMRELYLKAFEPAVKEAGTDGVMSAYNRIGARWCGGNEALLGELLRKEWGYDGYIISDYSSNFIGTGYMSPVLAVYAGNDTLLTGIWALNKPSHEIAMRLAYRRDPAGMGNALRAAVKNICRMKMKTLAFTEPDLIYDDSLAASLVPPDKWNWDAPYTWSAVRYIMLNFFKILLYLVRYVL